MNTDPPLWPVSVRDSWPVSSVQIRTVVSIDPDTIWGPRKAEHHVRVWTMERHRLERTRQVPCRTMTSSNWRHRTVPSCPYPTQHSPPQPHASGIPHPLRCRLVRWAYPEDAAAGARGHVPDPDGAVARPRHDLCVHQCGCPPSSARARERPMARACKNAYRRVRGLQAHDPVRVAHQRVGAVLVGLRRACRAARG